MPYLKDCFAMLLSQSLYPCISNMDFTAFVVKGKMIDNNFLKVDTIERAWIAANVKSKENPDFRSLGNGVCRFEFFEAIVRVA